MGGGVNTTALLILIAEKQMPCDQVVFADTGSERPETYEYLEKHIKPFCAEKNLPFVTVRSHLPTLEEYCLEKRQTPNRMHRWCTHKWKIRPIYVAVPRPCTFYMGIAYDEIHRVHEARERGFGKVLFNQYPLIDWKMSRADCIRAIEAYGWPVPIKSGCFFCPFTRLIQWEDLYRKYPELYERAMKIEQGDKMYPKFTLTGNGVPLDKLRGRWGHGDKTLDDFLDDSCTSGFCWA
jgi:hypothetical protein